MSKENNNNEKKEKDKSIDYISLSGIKWDILEENFSGGSFNNVQRELTGSKDEMKSINIKEYSSSKKEVESTGSIEETKFNILEYPFDRYIITVNLSPKNEFLGITDVRINKDFRNYKEKQYSQAFLNIEDFYFKE